MLKKRTTRQYSQKSRTHSDGENPAKLTKLNNGLRKALAPSLLDELEAHYPTTICYGSGTMTVRKIGEHSCSCGFWQEFPDASADHLTLNGVVFNCSYRGQILDILNLPRNLTPDSGKVIRTAPTGCPDKKCARCRNFGSSPVPTLVECGATLIICPAGQDDFVRHKLSKHYPSHKIMVTPVHGDTKGVSVLDADIVISEHPKFAPGRTIRGIPSCSHRPVLEEWVKGCFGLSYSEVSVNVSDNKPHSRVFSAEDCSHFKWKRVICLDSFKQHPELPISSDLLIVENVSEPETLLDYESVIRRLSIPNVSELLAKPEWVGLWSAGLLCGVVMDSKNYPTVHSTAETCIFSTVRIPLTPMEQLLDKDHSYDKIPDIPEYLQMLETMRSQLETLTGLCKKYTRRRKVSGKQIEQLAKDFSDGLREYVSCADAKVRSEIANGDRDPVSAKSGAKYLNVSECHARVKYNWRDPATRHKNRLPFLPNSVKRKLTQTQANVNIQRLVRSHERNVFFYSKPGSKPEPGELLLSLSVESGSESIVELLNTSPNISDPIRNAVLGASLMLDCSNPIKGCVRTFPEWLFDNQWLDCSSVTRVVDFYQKICKVTSGDALVNAVLALQLCEIHRRIANAAKVVGDLISKKISFVREFAYDPEFEFKCGECDSTESGDFVVLLLLDSVVCSSCAGNYLAKGPDLHKSQFPAAIKMIDLPHDHERHQFSISLAIEKALSQVDGRNQVDSRVSFVHNAPSVSIAVAKLLQTIRPNFKVAFFGEGDGLKTVQLSHASGSCCPRFFDKSYLPADIFGMRRVERDSRSEAQRLSINCCPHHRDWSGVVNVIPKDRRTWKVMYNVSEIPKTPNHFHCRKETHCITSADFVIVFPGYAESFNSVLPLITCTHFGRTPHVILLEFEDPKAIELLE